MTEFSKQEINELILNYLIFEGYESTGSKFAKEMEVEDKKSIVGINSIKFRKQIKLMILKGDIQKAIDELNLKYPELLETNQFLYFKLLLLNLIEMIKVHNKNQTDEETDEDKDPNKFILKIIQFAQDKLTNKAIKNPNFMEELELAMTLLLFSNNQTELPKKLNRLLEFKLRRDIADLINKAILLNDMGSRSLSKANLNTELKKFQEYEEEFNENDEDEKDNTEDEENCLIDSNLKKMIKFLIWSENNLDINSELEKFDI